MPDAKGSVESLFYEIHAATREQNLHLHVRPEAGVLEHERTEERVAKERIRRDTQDSLGFSSSVGHRAIRIIGQSNDLVALGGIRRSNVGKPHPPRSSLKQLDPQRAFELPDSTAERLLRNRQQSGRHREALRCCDMSEEAHILQLDCLTRGTNGHVLTVLSLSTDDAITGAMSTDVRVEVTILRSRAQVAAFMFDPTNDAIWTTGVVDVRPLTGGRLRVGSKVERTSKFLGRQFAYQYEVVEADDDRLVAMRVEQPFPMVIRYELADDSGGASTRATIHARGDAGGFYRIAAPLLNRMVKRSITNDLETLKEYLEAGVGGREVR
jgi:hypothetical protein